MGNDGGSIPDRRDLANQTRARPLQEPIVSCALGKPDIKVLKLTQISPPPPPDLSADVAKFVCPLTFKEMNGGQPFVYILTCGCVFSQSGLRTVLGSSPSNGNTAADEQLEVCPQCATKFSRSSDIFTINPPLEEEERMYAAMELRRSLEPVKKSKKRKAGADAVADEVAGHVFSGTRFEPKISAASRSLAQSLAVEEAKRKAGMSDAVKSLYRDKNDAPRKETFMTMGTFTRVSHSFAHRIVCVNTDFYRV
ncbi:Rtf2 RING-finger-domain-containing protein [Suillus variegatus]|nr:Rtf2 RING-finger-domain-containing protein [Suillus variegatus]